MLLRLDNHQPVNLPKNTTAHQLALVREVATPLPNSHKNVEDRPMFSIETRARLSKLR